MTTATKRKFGDVEGGDGLASESGKRTRGDYDGLGPDSSEEEQEGMEVTAEDGADGDDSDSDTDSDSGSDSDGNGYGDGEDGEEANGGWGWGRGDVRMEAFSMAKELRRGRFNEAGTYIAHGDDDSSDDSEGGLATVDVADVEKARQAQQQRERARRPEGPAEEQTARAREQVWEAVQVLCGHLRDGETTGRCLQRLYAAVRRERRLKKKSKTGKSEDESESKSESQAAIDAVTDSVAVLERHFDDVLERSRAAWAAWEATESPGRLRR